MAALLADHVPAAASHHAVGRHHPGAHLADDLRPGVGNAVRRPRYRHRHAEPLHVDRHLPAVPLRARRGDRDRAALDGRDPDRALPGVEPARRDRAMSILVSAAPRARSRFTPMRAGLYLLLVVLAVFYLTPVFAIIVTSLKATAELARSTVWELPKAADLSSYSTAFTALAPSFFNSVFLVVPATILSATLGSLNGYVLSKLRFRGSNAVFTLLLFGVTIAQTPTQQPITVALQNLAGSLAPEQNIQMAGALMAALPTLLIYILLGRYFVRGLLAGSLKG